MAWKGIKHKTVGGDLDQTEWESAEAHELVNGTTLPPSGNNNGDLYFKTDEKRLYIWLEP